MEILGLIERELSTRPTAEKAGFVEALLRRPETVAVESSPSIYYSYSLGNVASATSLLTNYWNRRRTLFGERAFMPLVTASSGNTGEAISSKDVRALQSGCVQSLPTDSSGRKVIFLNMSLLSGFPLEALMRASFLVLQSLSVDITQSSRGLVFLVFISDSLHAATGTELLKWACETVTTAMPLTLERLHVLKIGQSPSSDLFSVVDQIMREEHTNEVVFTATRSSIELFSRMKFYGILPSALPSSIDGHFRWDPRAVFRSTPSALGTVGSNIPMVRESNWETHIPNSESTVSSSGGDGTRALGRKLEDSKPRSSSTGSNHREPLDCNDSSTGERHRTRNAVYSRRKYLRKKIELEVLETESARLKTENVNLKRESQRLKELWRNALELVEMHGSDTKLPPGPVKAASRAAVQQNGALPNANVSYLSPVAAPATGDQAALLALRQYRFGEQVSNLGPAASLGLFPGGQQQDISPFLLNQTLQQHGINHLGSHGIDMSLPHLSEEQRRLLPAQLWQAPTVLPITSHWPSQDTASLAQALGRQPTQEDIQRFLRGDLL